MRTHTRITLGIATLAVGLAPFTAAVADDGAFQFPVADEGTTIITMVPVPVEPDDDAVIDPSLLDDIDLEVVNPEDDAQVDPSLLDDIDIEVLDPSDEGLLEAVPADPQMPDWLKEAIEQAVADALAGQGAAVPTDVTLEVIAPASDGDTSQAAAQETVTATEQSNPWPYAFGGAGAVLAVWAMLGLGARLAARRG